MEHFNPQPGSDSGADLLSDAVLLVAMISLGLYLLRQPETWRGAEAG